MSEVNHWCGVVSKEHVLRGVAGSFIQLGHGKKSALARLKAGDGFVFYSPRQSHPEGEALQAFTALGQVKTGEIYQHQMSEDFKPFRMDVAFDKALKDAPIKPLLEKLSFIKDVKYWGAAFRYGLVQMTEQDFELIKQAMKH
jgi:EVE domain